MTLNEYYLRQKLGHKTRILVLKIKGMTPIKQDKQFELQTIDFHSTAPYYISTAWTKAMTPHFRYNMNGQ